MCSSLLYFERRRQSRSFLCSAPVVRVVRSRGETSQGRIGVCLDRVCDFRTVAAHRKRIHRVSFQSETVEVSVLNQKKSAAHSFSCRGSSWLRISKQWLLLSFCDAARANFVMRTVRPELGEDFAQGRDARLMECFGPIVGADFNNTPRFAQLMANLPFGGLGFRSATRHFPTARWASWADAMARVQERPPEVAAVLVRKLSNDTEAFSINGVQECWRILVRAGFELPSWEQLAAGVRPHRQGRGKVSQELKVGHFRKIAPDPHGAPVGDILAKRFICALTSRETRCVVPHFHFISVGSATARTCREGGAPVTTNVFVRELDLCVLDHLDGRFEVTGVQLAVDTTCFSHCVGAPIRALQEALARKERTYPELVREREVRSGSWCSPVTLGADGLRKHRISCAPWQRPSRSD